ncbi:MAG: F0F1 ATP synthase subunit A [Planctomycetes bacterium]|nr:F0F1 ATP synthase subunit A [Planctomycetota bacterium]
MFLASGGGAFNPIEHLYDKVAVWTSFWGAHGTAFIHGWNEATPGFLHLSQHVIMMWLAAGIMLLAFTYTTYARNSRVPKGLRNFLEPIVTYIRDEVVRPNIKNPHAKHHDHAHDAHAEGHDHGQDHGHDHAELPKHWLADKFVPLFVCMFFFIAIVNLIGLIPGSTTASSAITFTGSMAVITLLVYGIGAFVMSARQEGSAALGIAGFFKNLVPYKFSLKPMDLGVWSLLFVIEIAGFIFIKPFALMVRLFANMTAGHCSLLSFLFINMLVPTAGWRIATGIPTVAMGVGLYALEIFVSILQAYIFTYLSAIFVGLYLVPEH